MHKKSLLIKLNGQRQYFEIAEDNVKVELNTVKHNLKYNIPFDQIENEIYTEDKPQKNLRLILLLSLYFNTLLVLCVIVDYYKFAEVVIQIVLMGVLVCMFCTIAYFRQNTIEVHVKAEKHLYFIQTKKNKHEIEQFISFIFDRKKEYLREKFFLIDPILPYHIQYDRFIWLYRSSIISENEFEVIKEDLDKYLNFGQNFNI